MLDHLEQPSFSVNSSSPVQILSSSCEDDDFENTMNNNSENNIENEDGCKNAFQYKQGNRIYVNQCAFDDIMKINTREVPDGIDGICIYVVPLEKNLKHCKGARPWGPMIVSNAKSWTKGPLLLTKGSYHCTNSKCLNLEDFGINRGDFETSLKSEETVRCKVCKSAVSLVPCNARLFVEQENSFRETLGHSHVSNKEKRLN